MFKCKSLSSLAFGVAEVSEFCTSLPSSVTIEEWRGYSRLKT